jgi:hypothetical protein
MSGLFAVALTACGESPFDFSGPFAGPGAVADDDDIGDDDTGDDDTTPEVDCDAIPEGPFTYTVLSGPKASEDLAFDDQGHVIGADQGNLMMSTHDGAYEVFVPGAGGFIAGIRALPGGDIVYSDVDSGTLFRIDKGSGEKTMLLSGLSYANGLEVDLDGFVYAAEQDGGQVRKVDPDTGEFTVVAANLSSPNGLSFSPDYKTLYVGSFGGGMVYAIEFDDDGQPGEPTIFVESLGSGALDGMAVDACGNVYVDEYVAAIVWRISPDGLDRQQAVDLSSETTWIPNMQWGSGVGGWETETLYVLDIAADIMYEVPLGVPDKVRRYP